MCNVDMTKDNNTLELKLSDDELCVLLNTKVLSDAKHIKQAILIACRYYNNNIDMNNDNVNIDLY